MTSRRVVAFALSVGWALAACATSGTWVKRDGVGTGGTDWTSWTNTENWVDGVLPSGYTDGEKPNLAAATGQYIYIPVALETTYIYSGLDYSSSRPVVLCDNLVYLRNSSASSSNCGVFGAHLYAPWSLYASSSNYIRFEKSDICGSGSPQASKLQIGGTVKFRYDRYANSSDVVRKNESYTTGKTVSVYGGAAVHFIGPRGSSEPIVGHWSQTAESPFLARVGEEHVLPVGTVVTGTGIPEGTFLKRIFPDGTIELSQPVTQTVADNEVTFAARGAVSYYAYANEFSCFNGASARNIYVLKYRDEDDMRIEFKYWNCNNTADYRKVNVKSSSGYLPGTLVMGTGLNHYHYLTLETCHLEFAPSVDSSYPAGMKRGYMTVSDNAQVRMTVTNNISAVIASVTNKTGTLTKDGAGKLTCGWGTTTSAGNTASLIVAGGVFEATGESAGMYVKNLTIKSGATFVVPEAGFSCDTLVAEPGAILEGRGELVCGNVSDESVANLTIRCMAFRYNESPVGPLAIEPLSGHVSICRDGGDEIFIVPTNSLVRVTGSGTADLLVVGGGGGGGHYSGGGGGGGGVVYRQSVQLEPGYYFITVGEGGVGAYERTATGYPNKINATNGGDSLAFSVTAAGGGYGGGFSDANGNAGASGGGGGTPYFNSTAYANLGHPGGTGIDGQGFGGGAGTNGTDYSSQIGGGGGGAGGRGEDGVMNGSKLSGGNGGPGRLCTIYGNRYYGGGGGSGAMSGRTSGGKGGIGGGGDGSTTDGSTIKSGKDGMENTGGGGGGAGGYTMGAPSVRTKGGNGGSGVVIIRYARAPRADGEHERNFAVGGAVKIRGVYEVHKFLDSGTLVIPEDAVADILVVGGGGGGGCGRAGGGGGGGVVMVTNRFLFAGTYSVTVGSGGAGSTAPGSRGSNGGFSSFDGVSPVASVYAYGGGGGGSMYNIVGVGANGSSGGGAGAGLYSSGASSRKGGAGLDGQGYAGGDSTNTTDYSSSLAGGGGGAGAPGTTAVIMSSSRINGDGGAGRLVAGFNRLFGGDEVFGGGGGGGGSYYLSDGETFISKGGAGGGGRGGGGGYNSSTSTGLYYPGEDGTDGFGGGGGGGGAFGTSYTAVGGNGGSGVVFVRFRVPTSGAVLIFR